jgi:hypothetical protein
MIIPKFRDLGMALTLAIAAGGQAIAQVPPPAAPLPGQTQPVVTGGWQFSVAPYLWMSAVAASGNQQVPGGTLNFDTNISFDNLLQNLNFAAMIAGEARNGNFLIATDVMYVDLSGGRSTVRCVNLPRLGAVPVGDSGSSLGMKMLIWTTVGGYAAVRTDAMQVDVIAGVRVNGLNTNLGWRFSGNAGLVSKSGSVSKDVTTVDGIVGLKGRAMLGSTGFSVPFYVDLGAGGSDFTWQFATGVAYGFGWGDIALTYRYLEIQPGNGPLHTVSLRGPMLAATFRF